MDTSEVQLLAAVESLRERQLQWTRDLIAIPTVNPYSGDESAGSEAAGQDWIERVFREMGGRTQRVPVPDDVYARGGLIGQAHRRWDGRQNVVAAWTLGAGRGPTILINNHMDTVGTHGMTIAPFDPRVQDGMLWGRGSSDTKGNTVLGLIAVQALLTQSDLNGRIIFASVVDEECDGAGAGTLACCLAGVRGDVAICLDGSVGQIVNGCNGIATARVTVRGRSGHNAVAGTSVNAIDKGIYIKQAVDAFAAEHQARHANCRTNIGIFRSGTLPSIVPSEAQMAINMSYPPEDAQESQRRHERWGGQVFRERFEAAMSRASAADPWLAQHPAEVSWIKDPYPYRWNADDPALQLASQAAQEVFGRPVPVGMMPAWFDGAHLARQLNVPTMGLGHGLPGTAHSADEHVQLDDLYRGAKVLALLVRRLLRTHRA
jgi:acetylornithine deacetylase